MTSMFLNLTRHEKERKREREKGMKLERGNEKKFKLLWF